MTLKTGRHHKNLTQQDKKSPSWVMGKISGDTFFESKHYRLKPDSMRFYNKPRNHEA